LPQETTDMPSEHPPDAAAPSYAEAVRRHPRVVLGIAAVAVLLGVIWLAVRSPVYEASAEILVAPVSPDDRALLGLEVVRDAAGDPTRTIQTAASLLESPSSAAAAASTLAGAWTPRAAQMAVRVEPLGQTSLVAVTAHASSPQEAVRVANAYATGALHERDRIVGAQIRQRLADLTAQLAALPPARQAASDLTDIRNELAALHGDPSLALAQRAVPPATRTGTPGWLLVGIILAVGLAAGAATAATLDALERYRPPPPIGRRMGGPALTPSPAARGAPEAREPRGSAPEGPRGSAAPAEGDAASVPRRPQAGSPESPAAAPVRPARPRAGPTDQAELVAVLARAMGDAGPELTREQFDAWRLAQPVSNGIGALPSAAVIARRLGGWVAARERARASLDAEADSVPTPVRHPDANTARGRPSSPPGSAD
jgi:capsular polysaccharide biosynthesis protein